MTDVYNSVSEFGHEDNNVAAAPVTVAARPLPDLWPTNVVVTADGGPYAGQPIQVSWTVFSGGPGATPTGAWSDAVYLSLDDTLTPGADAYLGSLDHSGALAVGGSYAASLTVQLPGTFIGPYYIFVKADYKNVVAEASETNNAERTAEPIVITVAPAADLVVTGVTGPITGIPGGAAVITYTLSNTAGSATRGEWWDGVYLSADGAWDTGDTLVGSLRHATALAAGDSLPVTMTVQLPAAMPGTYHLVVRTDIYNTIPEGTSGGEANNSAVSDQALYVNIPALPVGVTVTGRFTADDAGDYYVVTAAPGKNLYLALHGLSAGGWNEIYVGDGRVPTPFAFDQRAATRTADADLVIAATPDGGTYYILVRAAKIDGAGADYELRADDAALKLLAVTPAVQGNGADAIFVFQGAGFTAATQVSLVASDGTEYAAGAVNVISAGRMTATFAAHAVPAGLYTVRARDGAGGLSEKADAVRVVEGGSPNLVVNVTLPQKLGYHIQATIYVEYANTGDVAMPAPLLVAAALQNGQANGFLTLDLGVVVHNLTDYSQMPPGYSHSVQILASGQLAGILLPGERITVPVYYSGWLAPWNFNYPPFEFSVGSAGETEPINWEAVQTELFGDAAPNSYVWPQVCAAFGESWGSYVEALRAEQQYLDMLGYRTTDGRELFTDVFDRVRGMGEARVSGRLIDDVTGQPIAGVVMTLRTDAPDGIIRQTTTDADGRFFFERAIDDRYEIAIDGYDTDAPVEVLVLREQSVAGLEIRATLRPVEKVPDIPHQVTVADPFLCQVGAVQHMVFTSGGQVMHAVYEGTGWGEPESVTGATGSHPILLYSPTLIDGSGAGLALFWQTGEANAAKIMVSIARSDGAGGWEWSVAKVYQEGAVGSTGAAAILDSNGQPMVVWQMFDTTNGEDDQDLYYNDQPVLSTELSWNHISAIIALDSPALLTNGQILPQGTQVALMDDGTAWVVDTQDTSSCADWGFRTTVEFPSFKRGVSFPNGIPYIGGANEIEFGGSLETYGNLQGAGGTGTLSGSATFLQGRVTGTLEGSIGAAWKIDRTTCSYVFDQAKISGKIGIEGRFPIPQLSWSVFMVGKAEVGVLVGGELSGELVFTAGHGLMPTSGSVSGLMTLGFYGTVSVPCVKADVTGALNVLITLDSSGLGLSDIYLELTYGVSIGWFHISGSKRWPDSSPLSAQTYTSLDSLMAAIQDAPGDSVLTIHNGAGTGAVYGSNPLLANVAGDYLDDSGVTLVTGSDGLIYAFWMRESDDPTSTMGTHIVYATYDGSLWSAPQTVPGTVGFDRPPVVAKDADGHLVLAWAAGDASGFTISSDAQTAYDAYQDADVYYSELVGGEWSAPQCLVDLAGEARYTTMGTDAAGNLYLAWAQGDPSEQAMYVAQWDGSAWTSATSVATGFFMSPAVVGSLGGDLSLIWTQGVMAPDQTGEVPEESRLYSVSMVGGNWGAAAEVAFGAGILSTAEETALATQGIDFNLTLGTSIPKDCTCSLATPPGAPDPFLAAFWTSFSKMVGSWDPNDKIAPAGYGDAGFLAAGNPIPYEILFENEPGATAPARQITVTDTLDSDLDPYSLQFTEIAFAGHVVTVPAGLAYYITTVDLRPEGKDAIIRIEAGLNLDTRQIVVTLTALDPATGNLTQDLGVGVLYPNIDHSGVGEGHIRYSVTPLATAPTGAAIDNQARIVFDLNEPMDTPVVTNTVDADAPTSAVSALPSQTTVTAFDVAWAGADGEGSGIAGYDIYISRDDGPWTLWLANTAQTHALFTGLPSHAYAFYSRARDHVGLVESAPAVADASTLTPTAPSILGWASGGLHGGTESRLDVAYDGSFTEPRASGIRTLYVTFSEPIDPASLTPAGVIIHGTDASGQPVDLAGLAIGTSTEAGGTVAVITLGAALPNVAWYTIRLTGVTDTDGYALYGDADGNHAVDSGDVTLLQGLIGSQPGWANWNPRADLDGDAWISTRDWRVALAAAGTSVSPPVSGQTAPTQQSSTAPATPAAPAVTYANAEASGDVADTASGAFLITSATDGAKLPTWSAYLAAALDGAGDADWFRFVAPVSGTLQVDAYDAGGTGVGPQITLYEVSGDALQTEGAALGEVRTAAVGQRQYLVEVRRGDGDADGGDYRLVVRLAQYDDYLTLTGMDVVLADMPEHGAGRTIAVIDTGIDYRNPYLAGRVILGPDLADGDADPMDTVGHGTQVAGMLVGNNPHVPGLVGDARVIAIKVTPDGFTSTSVALIEQALQWVIDHQVQYNITAVSLSLGGGCVAKGTVIDGMEDLYRRLTDNGVFISVAAGNGYAQYGSRQGVNTLAASQYVAAVGAVWDSDAGSAAWASGARDDSTAPDRIASFSERDPGLDLLAPGADITGLSLGGGLTVRSGTSMASPFVAGVAVLVQEAGERLGLVLTPSQVLATLQATGRQVYDGDDEVDNVANTNRTYARVDALAAVSGVVPPTAETPPAAPVVPTSPTDSLVAQQAAESTDLAVHQAARHNQLADKFTEQEQRLLAAQESQRDQLALRQQAEMGRLIRQQSARGASAERLAAQQAQLAARHEKQTESLLAKQSRQRQQLADRQNRQTTSLTRQELQEADNLLRWQKRQQHR